MTEKRFSLVKPTLQTKLFIDFDWWQNNDRNWRIYLQESLCSEHQQTFANLSSDEKIDWVDPETAEVYQVDGLQHILMTHCAKQEGFLLPHTALVDAVFRLLLATGNVPISINEIAKQLDRQPNLILRTFSGRRVYKGIRPCGED